MVFVVPPSIRGVKKLKDIKNFYFTLPKKHRLVIMIATMMVLVLAIWPSEKATASKQTKDLELGKRYSVAVPTDSTIVTGTVQVAKSISPAIIKNDTETPKIEPQKPQLKWIETKVRKGDTLAKVFKRNGLSAKTTHLVSKSKGDFANVVTKLKVGDRLYLGKNEQGELVSLKYPLSRIDTIVVNKDKGNFVSTTESKEVEIRESIAHGVITSNFWNAGIEAGLTDGQIISLANLFQWDVDFAQDIRKGDNFHVVYEEKYVDGDYIGTGNILAAEFVNQDDPFQAIRFTNGEYYTAEGKSLKKAFLRAPVNFKYISSNFKPRRFHPIQKRWKSHNGTDYRAKTGTPVYASGNGKVTHSTYNKYNGNYVFIQHGSGIVTKYLHFSKRAVKKGQRVKQGQVIGYVGSTGMSEAPHLHYEFLVNGKHRNPRTVKLPDAKPIAKKHKAAFDVLAQQRLNDLQGSRVALLAKNGEVVAP